MSLAELVEATGLLKTTVFRILVTFEATNYLVRLDNGRYQLGSVFMQLGGAYSRNFRLEDHVMPVLKALAECTRESASFYVSEGATRVVLFRVDSPQAVRDVNPTGTVMAMDDTATGIVLSTFADIARDQLPSRSAAWVKQTQRLYGSDTASLSAPVFGLAGLLGALTLSGPASRFTKATAANMRAALFGEAVALSDRLSGTTVLLECGDD